MSDIFQSPLFAYLGQNFKEIDIYPTVFQSASPQIMGESPYLNAQKAGMSLALETDNSVKAIFLYAQGLEGFTQYEPPLPGNLRFETTREAIRSKLGKPALSAEAGGTGIMAIEHAFDRYESVKFYLRFEYEEGGKRIRLVTLGLNG